MLRNWRRSWFTSDAVKPADNRRSKPRGGAEVVVFASPVAVSSPRPRPSLVDDDEDEEVDASRDEEEVGGGRSAACASLSSSPAVNSSPMLQFT